MLDRDLSRSLDAAESLNGVQRNNQTLLAFTTVQCALFLSRQVLQTALFGVEHRFFEVLHLVTLSGRTDHSSRSSTTAKVVIRDPV